VDRKETRLTADQSPDFQRSSTGSFLTADERSQIAARLRLTPSERLRYLEDMIAFEDLARVARRIR
jgi:hypothetical protein